ncbi:hypothetical protein [Gordonia sp. DT30]|uniref:hypothetical protein n=1 Tax=Gordonia sp. DT30 TaxID=3416546 RepID=UPI003CED1492
MPEQHEDVWSRLVTVNGYRADELLSVLQKSIRRGLVEEASLAAYELYLTGIEVEAKVWQRLAVIAVEDVGLGLPNAPMLLAALNTQREAFARGVDRFMFTAHAIRLLAGAPKDRASMELAVWTKETVARGDRCTEVLDFHVDQHTRRGVAMGRGTEFWWGAGGYGLDNELNPEGSPWTDYVREVLGAHPGADVPKPDFSRPAPPESGVDGILESIIDRH